MLSKDKKAKQGEGGSESERESERERFSYTYIYIYVDIYGTADTASILWLIFALYRCTYIYIGNIYTHSHCTQVLFECFLPVHVVTRDHAVAIVHLHLHAYVGGGVRAKPSYFGKPQTNHSHVTIYIRWLTWPRPPPFRRSCMTWPWPQRGSSRHDVKPEKAHAELPWASNACVMQSKSSWMQTHVSGCALTDVLRTCPLHIEAAINALMPAEHVQPSCSSTLWEVLRCMDEDRLLQ